MHTILLDEDKTQHQHQYDTASHFVRVIYIYINAST